MDDQEKIQNFLKAYQELCDKFGLKLDFVLDVERPGDWVVCKPKIVVVKTECTTDR